jgi:tetratricopeptide (TPR) repeat protein
VAEQHVARPSWRTSWIGPVIGGFALVVAAFAVASYIADAGPGTSALDQLIQDLEAQVRADPGNPDLRVAVADAYLKDGRPRDALTQYEEALRLDDQRIDALYGMGLAYYQLGELDQAGAAFQTVVKLNQDNPMQALDRRLQGAHYYLGLVLREQGRLDNAINEFRIALGLNRADADTLVELGRTFALKEQWEDAVAAFEVAVAYVPDYVEAYRELEAAARAQGDEAKATYARAMIDVVQGDPKQAIEPLREVAEKGQSSRYWWALGFALEKTRDIEGAKDAYRRATDLNPGELLAADALRRLEETTEP